MLNMNQISVIVPIYNMELYLEECLESIVNQTEDFYEIILVNDGSTDKSQEICAHYCKKYSNMKLVSQENRGLGAARNIGMSKAAGNYIVFVDSDDYISLDMNQKIKEVLNANVLDVLYFNADIQYDIKTDEPVNSYRHGDSLNGHIITGMDYFKNVFPHHYIVCAWIAVYKKDFLEKYDISFPENIYYEDHFFSLQTVTHAQKVMCVPDSLYIRRCRENSITTSSLNEKKCRDMVENQKLMGDFVSAHACWRSQPDLIRKFIAQMSLLAFYNISKCLDDRVADEQTKALTELFLEKWLPLFLGIEHGWGECLVFLLISEKCKKLAEPSKTQKLIEKYYGTTDRFVKYQKKAKLVLENEFIHKLSIIPLNKKEAKVGIYGTGKHTESFMELYEQHFGEIKCELFFIVTSCEKEMSYWGRPVVSCHEIPKDVDRILLSSMPYQREMQTNLLHQGIDENKIVALYEKNDICDLIKVNWVFHEIK